MKDEAWWRQLCARIDAKDTPGFLAYLDDECDFCFANAPAVHGRPSIGAAVAGFWASIGGSRHEVLGCWGDAETAVCEGRCTYTRLDGSTVTLPFVDVLRFRGEKVTRYAIYIDVGPLYGGK